MPQAVLLILVLAISGWTGPYRTLYSTGVNLMLSFEFMGDDYIRYNHRPVRENGRVYSIGSKKLEVFEIHGEQTLIHDYAKVTGHELLATHTGVFAKPGGSKNWTRLDFGRDGNLSAISVGKRGIYFAGRGELFVTDLNVENAREIPISLGPMDAGALAETKAGLISRANYLILGSREKVFQGRIGETDWSLFQPEGGFAATFPKLRQIGDRIFLVDDKKLWGLNKDESGWELLVETKNPDNAFVDFLDVSGRAVLFSRFPISTSPPGNLFQVEAVNRVTDGLADLVMAVHVYKGRVYYANVLGEIMVKGESVSGLANRKFSPVPSMTLRPVDLLGRTFVPVSP